MVPRDWTTHHFPNQLYTISCCYAFALGLHEVPDSQTLRPFPQDWSSTLWELISVRRGRAICFRVTPFSTTIVPFPDSDWFGYRLVPQFWPMRILLKAYGKRSFLLLRKSAVKSGSFWLHLDVNKNAEKRCWPLGEPNLARDQLWGRKSRDLEGTRKLDSIFGSC